MVYWGKPTANIDWCEDNYHISYFIAEFWNTISSLAIVFMGLFGIYMVIKYRVFFKRGFGLSWIGYNFHFTNKISKKNNKKRLAIVGLGSFAFHATLLYAFQLSDEVPMEYGTLVVAYILFANSAKYPRFTNFLPYLLIIIGFTLSYLVFSDPSNPLPHQLVFGIETLLCLLKSIHIGFTCCREKKAYLFRFIFTYIFAFVCWLIERNFCDHIKFLQLHAVWHVFAGLASFMWTNFAIYHQLKLNGFKPIMKYNLFVVPTYKNQIN